MNQQLELFSDPVDSLLAQALAYQEWVIQSHERRSRYAKPVICELCQNEQHALCVRPCSCRHGRVK